MQQRISSWSEVSGNPALTGEVVEAATEIAVQPDSGCPPSLRRWAWAVLKSARGQTISQTGLNRLTGRHVGCQGEAQ